MNYSPLNNDDAFQAVYRAERWRTASADAAAQAALVTVAASVSDAETTSRWRRWWQIGAARVRPRVSGPRFG